MRTTAIGCAIALLMLFAAVAPAASPREIVVEVTSIAAATRPAEQRGESVALDPRLAPFSKNLKSLFAYDTYTFLNKDRSTVEFGKSRSFRLPEHFSIEVGPEQMKNDGDDMIEMMVTLYREKPRSEGKRRPPDQEREVVLRTKIRLKNGGTVLLGGPPIRAGVLVLALSARG